MLLNQFENLKQKGSVLEYQSEFEQLAHGLVLYNEGYDDTYFMNRFLIRLLDEIRAVITLHQPGDVATTSTLACLQEEEINKSRAKSFGKDIQRHAYRQGVEKVKGGEPNKVKPTLKNNSEDKLVSLRDFRRKNGLCFKCGGKWDKNHKCPALVPIHVLKELLDALDEPDQDDVDCDDEVLEGVHAVGYSETSVVSKRRTMKLHGQVGKIEVLILVDSGSVGTFISDLLHRNYSFL